MTELSTWSISTASLHLQTASSYQWKAASSPPCQPSSPLHCTESLSLWTYNDKNKNSLIWWHILYIFIFFQMWEYSIALDSQLHLLVIYSHSYLYSFNRLAAEIFSCSASHTLCDSHCVEWQDKVMTQNKNSYLFSLALCLKSSMAFLNRVALNSPLSLSSNSRLVEKLGTFKFKCCDDISKTNSKWFFLV